jgi:1,2-diacylglycerol 3-alpha-glucosyltransferase
MKLTRQMKIAFVTNNYTPYSGGVVSSVRSFAYELKRQGHEVVIITLDFIPHHIDRDEVTVVRVPCYGRFTYRTNPMAIPYRATRFLRTYLASFNPDIIHSQHPFLLGNAALAAARSLDIPVVFTYHTVYEDYAYYLPYIPRFASRWLVKALVVAYCKKVQLIITPSKTIQDHLEHQKIQTPMRFICSGLQQAFVNEQSPDKRSSTAQYCKLLVVSRFVPEKNIKAALDLYVLLEQRCPGRFFMQLIGFGPELNNLQDYAYRVLKFSQDQVTFVHKPDKACIAQAYRDADLFLFTSLTDVQPLALVESFAAATPIVALTGSGRAVIEHGFNGFVTDSLDGMALYVLKLADDDALRRSFQINAFATAQRFTPMATTTQLLETYQALIHDASMNGMRCVRKVEGQDLG